MEKSGSMAQNIGGFSGRTRSAHGSRNCSSCWGRVGVTTRGDMSTIASTSMVMANLIYRLCGDSTRIGHLCLEMRPLR
ncbi:hypothetical protein M6B38_214985 [Iris pallida]|uniref:Uncharacterized protein n=1 Tax=Iris pallida TaxID=29817 RepID=A0AAX6E1S6_IRIPA|nr:hypothetical protein M6B38_214980 [Iris pallida]KAJ6797910.1 hypothetical protein M6B38_214985 [Iris pallida]